jgi:hypothetical protein
MKLLKLMKLVYVATMAIAQCEVTGNIPVPEIPNGGTMVFLGQALTFDLVTRNSDRYFTIDTTTLRTASDAIIHCTSLNANLASPSTAGR